MNTPAHAVTSLLVLGQKERPTWVWPAIIGSVLPDAPMFVFYAFLKAIGTDERYIWSTAYYDPAWQAFFDLFNSLPLMLIILAIAYYFKKGWIMALMISMAIHVMGDLPFHYDDGHRHFFPFSDWRYMSPISYWDPAHYGNIFMPLEILCAVSASIYMIVKRKLRSLNIALYVILGIYALYFAFAMMMWMGMDG